MRQLAGPAALLIALWCTVTWIGPTGDDSISDLFVYRTYAEAIADGANPYAGGIEYPPFALAPMVAAWIPGGGVDGFELSFAALMLACALGALALARHLGGMRAAWTVALVPLLCGAVVRTRFDLLPVALMLAALVAFARERPRVGFALLGAGAMTKVFPALLVPVALMWLIGRGDRRAAAQGAAVFLAVVAVVSGPFLGEDYLDAYRFHLDRPVQIESTPATVAFAIGGVHVTGHPVRPDRFKSNGLDGGSADALATASAGLFVVVFLIALLRAPARDDPEWLLRCSLVALLAFVTLGKVLSPQFGMWLVPFAGLAWAWQERALALSMLAAVAFTQTWFPSRYFDLVAEDTGTIVLVAIRNALLLLALGLALRSLFAPVSGPGAAQIRWLRPDPTSSRLSRRP